jgi:protein TonB
VRVDPEYPPRARQQGIEGYVDVLFTISPVGTVQDAEVVRSKPSLVFDRTALRAIRKWKYNPKIDNGIAVARSGVGVRLIFEIPKGRR